MKTTSNQLLIFIVLLCFLIGCKSSAQDDVLAEKNGYKLTKQHIDAVIALAEEDEAISEAEKEKYKQAYIAEFLANPAETIKELENYVEPKPSPDPEPTPEPNTILAEGHQKVRDILGSDIGKMNFDSKVANDFRAYLANSLLSSSSSSYDGIGFRGSNARIQFCVNGTFIQVLSAQIGVEGEGIDAIANGTDYMPGYWEVASLPNNILIILFYSTHPLMLEDSPNGLLPFPVAQYTSDFVALPNGDGYTRTANQNCN